MSVCLGSASRGVRPASLLMHTLCRLRGRLSESHFWIEAFGGASLISSSLFSLGRESCRPATRVVKHASMLFEKDFGATGQV